MPKSWNRHHTIAAVATGMAEPRYVVSDMIRRSGFELDAGRLSFADVVLVGVLERQLRAVGVKSSERLGALVNALRPTVVALVERYGMFGDELFVRLDEASPVAVAWFSEGFEARPWRVTAFDSMRECGAMLSTVDPLDRESLDVVMIDLARAIKRAQIVVDRSAGQDTAAAESPVG